ncbi:MAG: hypothetical protein V4749_17870 [Pseudomonadota bacterium]
MIQASRYTPQELADLKYWEGQGYTFKRGEKAPASRLTPPSWATRHPKVDAALSFLVVVAGAVVMACFVIAVGAGLIR